MKRRNTSWILIAALAASTALAACKKEESETDAPDDDAPAEADTSSSSEPSASPDEAPSASATAAAAAPTPAPAGEIEAAIVAAIDGKEDGAKGGPTVAVTGAAFTTAAKWKKSKSGKFSVGTSADGKSHFAAAGFGKKDDPASKLDDAQKALGLTDCKWAPPGSATTGKDKLPATVADGLCKKGGAQVRTAYAAIAHEDINALAMGGWADGGKKDEVFGAFKSVKKSKGGGGIAACCAALQGNMASAPPAQAPFYMGAITACNAAKGSPDAARALGQIRAALRGASIPAACN